ncbi:PQQ-dependent sugar dehydrogenase [Bacillus sp. DJP31]|uniref:PQQ-dependent sugar dehydrogenase n=1 Tax=Bacillus sp. DJP31 TaxID=3409789 RepID=UPI003BB723EC
MSKYIYYLILLLIILTGCSINSQYARDSSHTGQPKVVEAIGSSPQVLVKNLYIHWTLTKHEDIFYISQREGLIVEVDIEAGSVTTQSLSLSKDVHNEGVGGLLGLVLAPDFELSKQAFAYYTFKQRNETRNRVIVLQRNDDTWIEKRNLLDGIPGGRIHNGGRMKLGPDGKLYVATGDSGNPELGGNSEIITCCTG